MSRTIVLRYNVDDYIIPFLVNKGFYRTHKKMSHSVRILYRIMKRLNLPVSFFFNEWKKEIKYVDKVIIFDYGYSKDITKFIKKKNSKCKIHIFYFNKIYDEKKEKTRFDENVDKIWSFDPGDCKKYDFNFITPFYTHVSMNTDVKTTNDIVFLGKAKDREKYILDFKNICNKQNIKLDFTIIKRDKDYIPYSEYLKKIENSSVIFDFTLIGQSGLTIRFMESIFLRKKIITNNKCVRNYDFYNPQNVFIIGVDDICELKKFIESSYIDIDKSIIDRYEFTNWKEKFI